MRVKVIITATEDRTGWIDVDDAEFSEWLDKAHPATPVDMELMRFLECHTDEKDHVLSSVWDQSEADRARLVELFDVHIDSVEIEED